MLVDEYDKPILDNLTDPHTARELRDSLRNLYSVIKAADAGKYRAEGLPIHLIGIEFSREQRTLPGFEVETLACP